MVRFALAAVFDIKFGKFLLNDAIWTIFAQISSSMAHLKAFIKPVHAMLFIFRQLAWFGGNG